MPNKPAALKELRKSRKRAVANFKIKTNLKQLFKKAAESKTVETARAYQQAADKASKRHILSKNSANRKKSAIMKTEKV